MEIPTREQVVERIDRFIERTGMAPSTLGRNATGEGDLVRTIKEGGRMPRFQTLQKLVAFMEAEEAKLDAPQEDAA